MKKVMSLGLILLTGLSLQAFAAAGYAKDGLEFSLVLIGFLLLLAGVLKGIDYIGKNRKMIIYRVKAFIKKKADGRTSGNKVGAQDFEPLQIRAQANILS